jgi:hypothetical protein
MATRKKKPAPPPPPDTSPISFEFITGGTEPKRLLRVGDLTVYRHDAPSCLNGDVRVHKMRVTVELVDEPVEVIQARIQDLWERCSNYHHWDPLKQAAAKVGLTLDMKTMGTRKSE